MQIISLSVIWKTIHLSVNVTTSFSVREKDILFNIDIFKIKDNFKIKYDHEYNFKDCLKWNNT